MTSADLQRLDDLPHGGTVAGEIRGSNTQGRRTDWTPAAQAIHEWRNVATAGTVEIDGNAVVEECGEISAGKAHSAQGERSERAKRESVAVLSR
jgi:hypothetical protein